VFWEKCHLFYFKNIAKSGLTSTSLSHTLFNTRYPHTLATLYKIGREEGVMKGLWRGTGPNVVRAAIGTSTQVIELDYDWTFDVIFDDNIEGSLLLSLSKFILCCALMGYELGQ